MLTDDEKQKIRLEEEYRAEVRRQLEEKKRKPSKVWTFLNSTLGIWLLSAIAITWAGTLYTQSQSRRAEELKNKDAIKAEALKNKDLIERLDLEIGYRLSQTQVHLVSLVSDWGRKATYYPFRPGMGRHDVREILDSLSQPANKKFPALYQEFSSLSTLALIAELRRHVSLQERDDLDRVLADLSGIYIFLDVRKVDVADVHRVGEAIFDGLDLPRWRAAHFYFSDCPFC